MCSTGQIWGDGKNIFVPIGTTKKATVEIDGDLEWKLVCSGEHGIVLKLLKHFVHVGKMTMDDASDHASI